ncbi:MAG TPA: hypothetical protein VKL61_04800, partial [Candidatus Polarisedimenticolia bacterium]|nr:hypothetical protein [Candidatus Polarisedimenticolia bacterium]
MLSNISRNSLLWILLAVSGIAAPPLALAAKPPTPEPVPAPCHPNPNAMADIQAILTRGDISHLPDPLKNRLARLAGRPHSALPTQAYAEADNRSQLFQYYLLDTLGFEPNVFTSIIPGVNDTAMLTVTGGNCGL